MGLLSQMRTASASEASAQIEEAMLEALNNIAGQTQYIANNTRLEYEILSELKCCRECLQRLLEIEENKLRRD